MMIHTFYTSIIFLIKEHAESEHQTSGEDVLGPACKLLILKLPPVQEYHHGRISKHAF